MKRIGFITEKKVGFVPLPTLRLLMYNDERQRVGTSDVGWVGTKWKPTVFQRNGTVGLASLTSYPFHSYPPYACLFIVSRQFKVGFVPLPTLHLLKRNFNRQFHRRGFF
jgi:hypothetical protein